jgi:proteic killer suppression protein
MAIQSFACKLTRSFYESGHSVRWRTIERVALRRLVALDKAEEITDLCLPPGNQLELLKGDRKGQYSIRINGQWRVCFVWTETGPANIEIVDYH